MKHTHVLVAILVLGTCLTSAQAQQPLPQTQNAALRYWLAFAELADMPIDKDTQTLLESVASGAAPWNEQRLGVLLDQNAAAIRTMQRATSLPECDWGLEYERGWQASIAPVIKGRVLARLNALQGMRQAARGNTGAAVETWIHGLRFAEHLSRGFSLVGALIAKSALIANMSALQKAVEAGSLNGAMLDRVARALRALPADGLDWSAAVRYEAAATADGLRDFARSNDPAGLYRFAFGEPAPAPIPPLSAAQIEQFETLMGQAADALRLGDAATPELAVLARQIGAIHPVIQRALPSLTRLNENRMELATVKRRLLDAIDARR